MKRRKVLQAAACLLLALTLLFCFAPPPKAQALLIREFTQPEGETERAPLTPEEREENMRRITAFLRDEMGLNDAAVAAILANMDRESGFDPLAVDPDRMFFGLCQWSRSRWIDCYYFCEENGLDRTSLDGQLAFFQHELESEYPDLLNYVLRWAENSEEGALEAQLYFCQGYEAPLEMERELELRAALVSECYWPLLTEGSLAARPASAAPPET